MIIKIPSNSSIFEDKKTNAQTLAIPFDFPDGSKGVIMITKLSKIKWQPSEVINNISINFK